MLSSSDFPYGKSGENFIRNIALGFHANDCEVEVVRYLGGMYNHDNDTVIKCSDYLYKKRSKNTIGKGIQVFINCLYAPLFVLYRKLFKKDRVFLIFGLKYIYELLPLLLFSKLVNIKIYQIVADHYDAEKIVPVWWKKPKYYSYLLQRNYFDRYFNGMIVLSTYLKELAIRNGVNSAKILLVPHFIVFSDNVQQKHTFLEKRVICYCGALSVENGIIDLIKAFNIVSRLVDNVELRLVGETNDRLLNQIKAEKLALSNIVFTGFQDKKRVEQEMAISTVLVNPRKKSDWANAGFPTKIGEYFATKTTVVTTEVGDLKSYFKDKREVVFAQPDNPHSLADAISFVLNHKEEAKQIGLRGYAWAVENLDYRNNALKMKEFFSFFNKNS